VHLVPRGRCRSRSWERGWKLVDHTGVHQKIVVTVDEDDPAVVVLRSGARELIRAVPPWISRRGERVTVSPEEDALERGAFYDVLVQVVRSEVAGWS